jgi:hypothetical protein
MQFHKYIICDINPKYNVRQLRATLVIVNLPLSTTYDELGTYELSEGVVWIS